MKRFFLLAGLLFPAHTSAHVRWFVEDAPENTTLSLTDTPVIVWIVLCVVLVGVALLLERRLTPDPRLLSWVKANSDAIIRVFYAVVGAHLLLTIALGHLIAPGFLIDSPTMIFAAVLYGLAGVSLLTGRGLIVVGPLFMAAYVMVGWENGWQVFEHLHMLGIGYFVGMLTLSKHASYASLTPWALPVLRVTLGVSLILLGLQEKLLHPDLALDFLETHNWNFMIMLGMEWFDDTVFVVSAGMTELLFGVIYLTGAITRINTMALSVFFITTAIVLGPKEINGHLTLIAVAVLFTLLGSGDKLKIPMRRASLEKK